MQCEIAFTVLSCRSVPQEAPGLWQGRQGRCTPLRDEPSGHIPAHQYSALFSRRHTWWQLGPPGRRPLAQLLIHSLVAGAASPTEAGAQEGPAGWLWQGLKPSVQQRQQSASSTPTRWWPPPQTSTVILYHCVFMYAVEAAMKPLHRQGGAATLPQWRQQRGLGQPQYGPAG